MADEEKQTENTEEPPKRKFGGRQEGAGRPKQPRKNTTYKVCKKCQRVLPASEFYKKPSMIDGLFPRCKSCMKADRNNINHKKSAERRREKLIEQGATKVCTKCGQEKSVEEFNKNSRKKDGLADVCKQCVHDAAAATRQKKLERQEQEQLYLLERENLLRKGRKNFFNFCQILAPQFYKPTRWHLWLLCNTLQALYERHLTKKYFYALCTMPHIPKWLAEAIDWERLRDDHVYTNIMINMPPRSGKCLDGETLITLADGTDKFIKDIAVGDEVVTFDKETYKFSTSPVTNFFDNGEKETLRIKLYSGREIVCTPNHRLLTINGWVMAKDLKEYDKLIGASHIDRSEKPKLPWGYAKIMGYLVADGSYTKKTGIEWTKAEQAQVDDLRKCLEYHGWKLHQIDKRKYHYCLSSGAPEEYRPNKKTPSSELRPMLGRCNSYTKRIPQEIMNGNREDIADFLGTYFSGDGTVSAGRGGTAEYSSVSRELLLDVQRLLLIFGVFSTLRVKHGKYKGEVHTSYRLAIVGKDMITFYENIPVIGKKREKLKAVCEVIKNKSHYPEHEAIHRDWRKWIKSSTYALRKNGFAVEKPYKVGTAKQVVARVAEFEDNAELRKIISDEIVWERIKGIENNGVVHTYDIEVEGTHNFLANGVVSHNSRSLTMFEQWLLGKSKENRIITVSYNNDLASDMSRYVRDGINQQKNMPTDFVLSDFFPDCKISKGNAGFMKWALEGSFFNYMGAGMEGSLTGSGGNCLICDDLIKNAKEAYNERVLDGIWNWYIGTFLSRAEHTGNGSIQIINFTRWSTKDLCGRILEKPTMSDDWINLIIPVEHGGELYCEEILPKVEFERLRDGMDTNIFEANYYQKPLDVKGRLFSDLKTYDVLPEGTEKCIAYCDTADEGDDYLACVVGVIKDGEGYITDIYFTQDNMQITEPATADLLVRNKVNSAKIESNNGGKGFARNVERLIWDKYHTKQVNVEWFHQTENKMARILTGATFIQNHVYFPEKWDKKWPEFYKAVMGFSKEGKNKHDDGVEALVEWGKMITGDGSINSYVEWMKKMQGVRA